MVGGGGILLPSRDASFERQWSGTAFLRGPQALALPLLTLGSLGAQVVWSVEMAYASPYLLELGMAKSGMAVVFVAGPLSGLLVQPLIGESPTSRRVFASWHQSSRMKEAAVSLDLRRALPIAS